MNDIDITHSKQTIQGPDGIKLILDASEIYPSDPGQGTPAMIELETGETGTFWCVADVDGVDGKWLTNNQKQWVASLYEDVGNWETRFTNLAIGEQEAGSGATTKPVNQDNIIRSMRMESTWDSCLSEFCMPEHLHKQIREAQSQWHEWLDQRAAELNIDKDVIADAKQY